MRESYTASNYTSDTDLPKFEVTELLESLAVVLSSIIRWPGVDRSRVGWGQDSGSIAILMGVGE
jgi:hypothetical protein